MLTSRLIWRNFLHGLRNSPLRTKRNRREHRRYNDALVAALLERLEDRTLLSAGTLDPTFDFDGRVTTDIQTDYGYASAVLPDGKLLLGGRTIDNQNVERPVIVRYNSNGSPDSGYGDHGK